jgi:hypothetical protein
VRTFIIRLKGGSPWHKQGIEGKRLHLLKSRRFLAMLAWLAFWFAVGLRLAVA